MPRISYLNGRFLPHAKAAVPIEDRGLQFSDAVYEVIAVFNGKPLDLAPHFRRLKRSLGELGIRNPLMRNDFARVLARLVRQNGIREGLVYLQITRGVAPRDHAFPPPATKPTVIMTARPFDVAALVQRQKKGVGVLLVDENRWARPDIKSTSLLGNVLAKQAARAAGRFEAVYKSRNGFVTEGTSSNVWIVTAKGEAVTRTRGNEILAGITRDMLLPLLKACGVRPAARPFRVRELLAAREAFLTSTSSLVMPIVKVSAKKIGPGKPGPVTQKLITAFWDRVRRQTGFLPPA
ncbi:MAG TPA: D-amino-acid transaminase [Sphingomonadales bacterium]|nr:D-amino-acid transaminase [Sphingomonadales bacterium]